MIDARIKAYRKLLEATLIFAIRLFNGIKRLIEIRHQLIPLFQFSVILLPVLDQSPIYTLCSSR
jgi:hypothetical protein